MRSERVQGWWTQARGLAREFWGEVTGNELEFNAGLHERLVGKIQEQLNISRDEAEKRLGERKDLH